MFTGSGGAVSAAIGPTVAEALGTADGRLGARRGKRFNADWQGEPESGG
jgi:hypothetical protein